MIVEGRESGKNVGIYDQNGQIDAEFLQQAEHDLHDELDDLIWESPEKDQQVHLIHSFGTNVNLGNINPVDVYSVECLRRGLRADTFIYPKEDVRS